MFACLFLAAGMYCHFGAQNPEAFCDRQQKSVPLIFLAGTLALLFCMVQVTVDRLDVDQPYYWGIIHAIVIIAIYYSGSWRYDRLEPLACNNHLGAKAFFLAWQSLSIYLTKVFIGLAVPYYLYRDSAHSTGSTQKDRCA